MLVKGTITGLIICLLAFTTALASPFDGWSVDDIRNHSEFVKSNQSMSSAMNSGDAETALRVYEWIGYIPVDDSRVYFTSFGEPLTCVLWEETGEWVPAWVYEALQRLLEEGYIKMKK